MVGGCSISRNSLTPDAFTPDRIAVLGVELGWLKRSSERLPCMVNRTDYIRV